MDPEVLERITARRAELDGLEEQLVKQLVEVRAERDELAVAERVLQRLSEQIADEQAEAGSLVVQVAGRAARLVPDRAPGLDTGVRGKLEPLRGKLTKPADRGWLHKRPDGRFTARP
ncbi:hypothetical protein [Streptomyces lincolnensis]